MDDQLLLERFIRDGSQDAFRELTERYTNLVYGCAVQRLRDAHAAQDVTQAVFLALALKAKGLRTGTPLPGWLFNATRFACAMHQRGEQRRKEREMRAFEESQIADAGTTTEAAWVELQPHLAVALDSLSGADREAVLLRFYRKASHQEVAAALRTSEDGARMRVDRALDKLRRFFTNKGVALSATALAGALTANAAQAAPAGLAASAGATALAGASGTATTTSIMTLAQGAMKAMLIAQVKTAVLVTVAAIAVGGAGVTAAVAVAKDQAKPAAQVAAAAVTATNGPATQSMRIDPAAVVITPRTWNAWEAFAELDRKGGPRVVVLGGTDRYSAPPVMGVGMKAGTGTHSLPLALCLLVPPEMRFVPVGGRKLIEAVAASRRLKTAWSRDGSVAVLHEGVPDAEVDVLRKDLVSSDAAVRREAAWRAGWMRDARVVPLLVKAAKDADTRTARKAVEGLRRLKWIAVVTLDDTAIDLLAAELNLTADEDGPKRSAAVGALAYASGEQRLDLLEKALADKYARYAAAGALGYVGGDRAVGLLEKVLAEDRKGDYGYAPYVVVASLARLGSEQAWAIIEKKITSGDLESRNLAVYGLTLMDGDKAAALALLEKACADQDVNIRRNALKALGRVGGDKALALIEKALGDWSNYGSVHFGAVEALGDMGGDKALALIEKVFNAGGNETRCAAHALSNIGGAKALALLDKALDDKGSVGAYGAAHALCNFGGDKALALIEKAMADQNDHVREYAAEALGSVGDEKALALIERTIADIRNRVLGGGGAPAGAAAEAIIGYMDSDKGMALLEKTLANPRPGVGRAAAIAVFHAVGDRQALPLIEKSYATLDPEMRRVAILALARIGPHKAPVLMEKALTELDADVRRAAAEALKELGGDKALAILEKALVSQDAGIRQAAIMALGHEGGAKARDLLLGRLAGEKDLLKLVVHVLQSDFPGDPAVEKALKEFKLPAAPSAN